MKRIAQALAAFGLAAFVLVGCQNKDSTAKKLDELRDTAKDIQRNVSDKANDLKQGASDALEDAGKAAEDLLKNIKK